MKKIWSENKSFIVFIALMVIFRSSFADINHVPSGSMKPGMIEGDRIIINKLAYDLQIPFSYTKIASFAEPKRGDIIVFNSKASENRLVKRVIGVPGDVVSMKDNVVTINGDRLDYEKDSDSISHFDLIEDLNGTQYPIRLSTQASASSSFAAITVPKNAFLALGDNRDNSADSRVIGFVPRSEIIGRSRRVLMSLDPDYYYLPRRERFFKAL